MGDEDLVVAVRLCDTLEAEQPDPLCLQTKELESWPSFEALLRSMYKSPPDSVSVSYLDDENDWIQLGSDAELREAVRVTKNTGEILQLQVKRIDNRLINLESSDILVSGSSVQASNSGQPFVMYIPTTDPGGDVWDTQTPLTYPHPQDVTDAVPVSQRVDIPMLVYPHPEPVTPKPIDPVCEIQASQPMIASEATGIASNPPTRYQNTSDLPEWDQAADMSIESKLMFLKALAERNKKEQANQPQQKCREPQVKVYNTYSGGHSSLAEPLCSEANSLGKNFVPNQDPFEVESSTDLEHVPLNFEKDSSPTLTPTRADAVSTQGPNTKLDRTTSVETDNCIECATENSVFGSKQFFNVMISTQSNERASVSTRASYSAAMPKRKADPKSTENRVPMPMPRTLLMMEGAQSGANAVAIEMPSEPDSFHGTSVDKDQEIAASGGTSSTSASEETGEVMARADSHAAAVSREVKAPSDAAESCAVAVEVTAHSSDKKSSKKSESKSKHHSRSSSRRERSEKKHETLGEGAKPKHHDRSERKKKKSHEHSVEKDGRKKSSSTEKSEKPKEEKRSKVTEDVESGEKVNAKVASTALQYKEFVDYMKEWKRNLHKDIVHDMSKRVDNMFIKHTLKNLCHEELQYMRDPMRLSLRDMAHHEGIYCDSCNHEIYGCRYKCGNCPDFDLCEQCERKPNIHPPTHVFLKIVMPARQAGVIGSTKYALLRENIYEVEVLKPDLPNREDLEHKPWRHLFNPDDEEERKAFFEQMHAGPLENYASFYSRAEERKWEKGPEKTFDLQMAQGLDTEICNQEEHTEEKPDVVPLTKLMPSTPVPVPVQNKTEDVKDDHQSDSGSSIVPVSPPPPPHTPQEEDLEPNVCVSVERTQSQVDETALCMKEAEAANDDDDDDEDDDDEDSDGDTLPELITQDANYRCVSQEASIDPRIQPSSLHDDDRVDGDTGSDTSDDFCIIDPPSPDLFREDYEIIPGGDEPFCDDEAEPTPVSEVVANQPTESHVTQVNQVTQMATSDLTNSSPSQEIITPVESREVETAEKESTDVKEEESQTDEENIQEVAFCMPAADAAFWANRSPEEDEAMMHTLKTELAAYNATQEALRTGDVEGLVHKMTEEEKIRFYELLRAELDSDYAKDMMSQALQLQNELKKQKEREEQIVLEAKQKEAAFVNERLEWAAQEKMRVDSQSQMSRQTSTTSVVSSISETSMPEENSSAESVDRKDADCQTNPEPHPASHLIQNVASGVTKAASTAISTAKDVFYSLQAKQNEWKPTACTYKPPQSSWKPPQNSWKPPQNTWKPPENNWTPPEDVWTPPTSNWTPPKSKFVPPNIEWITASTPAKRGDEAEEKEKDETEVKNESIREVDGDSQPQASEPQEVPRRSSGTTALQRGSPLASLEIADTALRREIQGMQRLIEMGFANRDRNRQLLNQYDNDLEKVVQSLLQEEGEAGDEHWAFRRH